MAMLLIWLAPHAAIWTSLRSKHFTVVSNASEQDARLVASQFEMIRSVFLEYFGNISIDDQPIIIVAGRDEATLKLLLPEAWILKGAAHRSGIYISGLDKSYIGLRVDVALYQQPSETFEPIYHEYFHYLTRRIIPQLPLWVVEGLAEFYGNTHLEGKKAYIGAPSLPALRVGGRQDTALRCGLVLDRAEPDRRSVCPRLQGTPWVGSLFLVPRAPHHGIDKVPPQAQTMPAFCGVFLPFRLIFGRRIRCDLFKWRIRL